MRAGKLRHRVTFERKSAAQNAGGEQIVTWTPAATVWASVDYLTGREYRAADGEQAQMDVRVTTRYHNRDINPAQYRVTHKGRVFDIVSVAWPEDRDILMVVIGKENVPDIEDA